MEIERAIVSERRAHPRWGPKKIRQRLICRHGIEVPPSLSTIGAVLQRNGMVTPPAAAGWCFYRAPWNIDPSPEGQPCMGGRL